MTVKESLEYWENRFEYYSHRADDLEAEARACRDRADTILELKIKPQQEAVKILEES